MEVEPARRQRADAARAAAAARAQGAIARGGRRSRRTSADWWQVLERRALAPAEPINPQLVFCELSKRLPDGAILTADSGSAANWYARDLQLRAGMLGSLSGTLASMGAGVPYAIAAKFAFPDRPVIALVGDGAMQMNGLAELLTIAKYRERWADPRLDRARAQQPRPQQGHLGAARDVGRPEVRRVAGAARFSLRALRRDDRLERHPRRRSRRSRSCLGSARWPASARP